MGEDRVEWLAQSGFEVRAEVDAVGVLVVEVGEPEESFVRLPSNISESVLAQATTRRRNSLPKTGSSCSALFLFASESTFLSSNSSFSFSGLLTRR